MNLEIANLANEESRDYDLFLQNLESKLNMNFVKSEIVENTEWIDEVLFTIPYLVKAFQKANKNIITEEEILKTELIKKVTVESVKHLAKHVNMVSEFNEDTGEIIPEKLLNANKEESYVTYENRFLYTLILLIGDFIYIRNKASQSGITSKGKNKHMASYEATTKVRKEKIQMKFEYSSERISGEDSNHDLALKINQIQESMRAVKSTEIFKMLNSKKIILVKSPLKMTNVLLKNVNYQYAVKLWNYLNDNFDLKNKTNNLSKEVDEKGYTKKLIDESILLEYIVFNKVNARQNNKIQKNVILTKEEQKEISDELMKKLFETNPDMAEDELKKMITRKYIQYRKSMEASTKPIKDRFKEAINNYLSRIEKMRLK